MKAYEFAGEVTADGQLKLPESALAQLVGHHAVRVIVLVQDLPEVEEEAEWSAMVAEQFLAGYSEADAIYDTL
ncbi:hypothetical protein H6F75_13900 [Nodosilinea sp. FACHB-131]|uniref:hypothetical protein n=1 Tax=Cyanophyceae TaxID=3028117 RepID=UPI00168A1BB7|nr:hypothetical protein [Nodosilinea sp. FACHB-131]MBD1874579.1 hypothetical protein [Nodosilinea sp. FACHB-131]